jgi:RNA polymerase sigma-70 factor (ECF subfamily)
MTENEFLAEQFEKNRSHLRAVAYRMLGSLGEADDAVQEAWLRLSRTPSGEIENLGGWLTTVVARVCLDILRSRKSRREEPIDAPAAEPEAMVASRTGALDPEQETLLADSVGLALLVVLDRLSPAERLAFVLHDMFAMSFEEIAPLVGRTPTAARQLASRARRRVQGAPTVPRAEFTEQRKTVSAFLAALRSGDFEGLMAVLDPNVVVHLGEGAGRPGAPSELHGAENWARGAIAYAKAAKFVQAMLINGDVGLVWAPRGRLLRAMTCSVKNGRIAEVEIIADPARLLQLDLATLEESAHAGNVN